ncbi:MAG TPA: serine hydrolase domain-containing protein [Steroidobacteraceae bacterium]|nr:serine hydrolase domain-containing protein [Steroidobacteraceae bacterium]
MSRLMAAALCLGLSAGPLVAAPAPESLAGLGAKLDKIRVEESLPALSVAIAMHGKIIYETGFGWADRENRVAATEHTMFSLASVSKPITTTGLMTLVQAGKIDLDRPVNDYLGDAKLKARVGDADKATVRRVANHSSGLPLHYQYFFADEPYQPPSRDESILHYGNLVTPPGEHYQYSNLGFGVLDYVISRVSGREYADFMRQEVFLKLGMTHTSIGIGRGLEPFAATRYDDDGAPLPSYRLDTPGAGGAYSSAHDLARFGMFHLKDHLAGEQAILSDAMLDEMHRPTMAEGGSPKTGYAIGWEVIDRPDGYRVVTHTGGMPGVATALILVPKEDLAVVLLANGFRMDLMPAEDLIMGTLLPKWKAIPEPPAAKAQPFRPAPELVGTWVGYVHTYAGDRPLRLQIPAEGPVVFQCGDQTASVVSTAAFDQGTLSGTALGDLSTPDLKRHEPYVLDLNLQLRRGELTGDITATRSEGRPFGLSHWTELHKQPM